MLILVVLISVTGLLLGKNGLRANHPDPSYNPIRSDWVSGSKVDLPIQHSKKLGNNNKALIDHHSYRDVTRQLHKKALHKK